MPDGGERVLLVDDESAMRVGARLSTASRTIVQRVEANRASRWVLSAAVAITAAFYPVDAEKANLN
jgi:hypothetical protein